MEEDFSSTTSQESTNNEPSQSLENIVTNLERVGSYRRSRRGRSSRRHSRNESDKKTPQLISRRNFIKLATVGILAAGVDYATTTGKKALDTLTGYKPDNDKKDVVIDQATEEDVEQIALIDPELKRYEDSLIYAGINMLASEAIKRIAHKLCIPVGNLTSGENGVSFPQIDSNDAKNLYGKLTNLQEKDEDLLNVLLTVFAHPLAEELLFRYMLPKFFINKNDKNMRWDVGVATSYLFGYTHNIAAPEDINPELIKKVIPINQIGLGLVCYYLSRSAGFSQAFVAHSGNNALALMLNKFDSLVESRKEPPKSKR